PTESDAGDVAAGEDPKDVPTLLRTLEEWRDARWPELSQTMPVRGVTRFASDVGELAERHSCARLAGWAATLHRQATTFRPLEAEETLTGFPALVDDLRESLS